VTFTDPVSPLARLVFAGVTAGCLCAPVQAGCGVEQGGLRLLSDDWAALNLIAERAGECAGEGVTVDSQRTREHKALQVPGLSVTPARYTSAVVSNNTIVPLLDGGLIRPLDELVERFAPNLPERQLIRIDGLIMAIAFNANAQHLYYREDLLDEVGLAPPATYDELLEAASTLRSAGIEQPLVGTLAAGWDLANEFLNLYLGLDARPFQAGSAEPAIQGEAGIQALQTLKALSEYMDPDFLSIDSNELQSIWQSGSAALAVGWNSRADALLDSAGDAPEVAERTALSAAPAMADGAPPAAALWWNGFTIASNIAADEAEASFLIMLHAIDPALLDEHAAVSTWLIEGYEPTATSQGLMANVEAGAKPYPMLAPMGLLHTAIGDNLADYLQGSESAEQALADAAEAYRTTAREQGFIE